MAKKPLQTLYESLRASNYDVPDNYGSFERTLTAPGKEGVRNRQTLYKALRDNNYDVHDTYESFSRTLFSPVKPTGGTAATGQSMLPADVEERRMRTRNKRETHPLNKSRARQRLQAQQQAIEAQQQRWEQDNKRFKEDIARREQRLPGGMDRFEERAKEQLATGEAAPVPLAPNDEVVRGDIAFNPDTGRMEQTYTTPEGGTFFDRDAAQFDHSLQNMPDDEIEMLERERELIGMGILRRGRELDEEYENQSWWDRFLAGLGTDPEMGPGPRERMAEEDEELQSLLTAWRKNRNALRILYDERNNDMNSFWHNFGTTVANGYTFTGGRAELHDAQAILNSSKRMDEIQRKIEAGEKLSNVENAALSLAQNTAWDNAIQAMYGDDYGAWATAGGAAVQSLEMMPEFIAGMPVLKGMGTAAIKLLTRNAAKGFGRFMLKGLGMTLGTMAGGAIMANTIQAERTLGKAAGKAAGSWWFGDDGEFMLGHYDGDNFVSGGESLAAALFHAEQEAIPEAASEGAGEFLPGIGQVLSKIGLSRIAKPLASLSGKGWYKTYQNMLRAAGWHGVGGEALEEYVGTLDGLIMGDVEGVKRLADPRTHFDIWLSCATLGPLLNAPVVLGSSMRGVYSPVAYHKLKAAVTRQDKIASFRLTEDRWAPWRDRIDATPNEQMADLMVEIRDDQDLAPQEKKAIFDYVKALQGYRGWNLGEYIFGKDSEEDGEGKTEQEQQQSQEYSNGYETVTPEERRAAKDRLDVARAKLEQKGYSEQWMQWLDNAPAEDVMNDLTERGLAGDTEAVMEYLNAKSAYDGMLQRVNDDIDDEVAVANEAIDQRIAPEDQGGDGMIHPAVLKGGREVFIISGNVATLADNSIDVENSDGMIIVRDAEGNEDTISPDKIQSLGEVIDPAQQRQEAEQMIVDEQGQAAAAQIEGQLPFNVGDQYTINYQGEPHTYQVVQADGDNVAVLVDGAQEPVVLTKQQLQQMADEERAEQIQAQAAAADAVEEEPAAVEPEQPVEAPAVEEAPVAPVAPEDNPTAAMPMDDQGEPAWDQVEPERGHQFLYQESGWPQAMADNFVQKRIDDAEKALTKAQEAGQKLIDNPKPTFSAQQQAVAENTAAQQAAQSALDYWKGVQGIQAQATAPVVEETAPVVETPAEQEPTEQAPATEPVAEVEEPAAHVETEVTEPVEETPAVETPAVETPAPVAENEMQPVEVEQPAEAAPAAPAAEESPQSDAIQEQPAGEETPEQTDIELLQEEFEDELSRKDIKVEVLPETFEESSAEMTVNVTVDGQATNIWFVVGEGNTVDEHWKRISEPFPEMSWQEVDDLAEEYNQAMGKTVCDANDEAKRINFKDIEEAIAFEKWMQERARLKMLEARFGYDLNTAPGNVSIIPNSVEEEDGVVRGRLRIDGKDSNIWVSVDRQSGNLNVYAEFEPGKDVPEGLADEFNKYFSDEEKIAHVTVNGDIRFGNDDIDVYAAVSFFKWLDEMNEKAKSQQGLVADIQHSIESQGEVPTGEKPKAFKIGEVTSNDGNRKGYALGVYHDPSGTAVATDGYIMVVDSREYDEQNKGKVIAQSNIKKGSEIKEPIKKGEEVPVERYPNWKSVFPKKKDTDSVKVNFNALCGWLAGVEKRMKEQWQQWKQEHPGEKMSFDNWRSRSAVQILMPDGKVQQFKFDNLYTFARAAASQGAKTLRYYPNQDNRAFSFDSKFGSGLVMPYNMEHYSYIDNPYRVENGLGVDMDSSLFTYDMSNGLTMPGKTAGNRVELNYESGKDAESRAYIEEVMEREGWDEEAKSEFRKILDDAADLVSRMAQGFTRLREWNNKKLTDEQGNYNPLWRVFDKDDGWIPTRSSFKKNGEYPYNIDLGALCTKREAFDAVVRYIKEQGWGQNLGPTQIEALKSLLREHGFLTACDICFNETRRARALDYGNAVAYYWNAVRQAVGIDDDLPIGTPRELTEEQMKRLTELSKSGKAFSKYVPKELRRTYETYVNTKGQTKRREVDKGLTPTMTRKVAKLFLQDPSLMGKFEGTMVLSTDSVDALVRQFPHTDIARFLAGAWGSNTPKPNEGFNIYDPLSWKQTYDKKRQRPSMEWFFNLGGMRAQSFSDYSPIFFYDYVQMFTDLAIRRLPIHIYTKVPALIKLFGGTGAKFNMSLVPEVVQGVDAEHLGLKPDGNGGWVYAWHDDSFPVDEAFALRQDPRFKGNVGTIAVGISDAHIRMLLDDPTIDMVIPYHKSGMPPSIQVKTGLDKATDYTDDQHSKKRGKALKNDFSFNEALRRLGDPRKAADEYLAWCKENNYTPKYPQFAEHPNYYKVLEDFRCIDNEGNYSPQQPVQVSFFDDVEQRLSESLEDRTMQEGLDNAIRGNAAITEGIEKIMSKPRLDGKIRDMMLARLKQVLGKDNVASLKQEDFFEELQKVYTDQMGAERAQQQVEVLRTSGGIVYGFAVGDRIVLNENYFNAETPMHEFTHVWVKVARLANPQMWAEGKELLKQTKEWQEVMSDEFYRDIQGDEDAVASEVLARIVGQDAARQINEMFAPEDKPQERPGIYNKIKQWVNKFLDGVRSLFSENAKGLTYDELVRMPMKALFDDAEAARFMEALAQVNEEDNAEFSISGGLSQRERDYTANVLKKLRGAGVNVQLATEEETQRVLDAADKVVTQLMRGWHGSHANFDAFDHSHMGEGEGAQAYGWGTYITEVEGIARKYASAKPDAATIIKVSNGQRTVRVMEDLVNGMKKDLDENTRNLQNTKKWIDEAKKELADIIKQYGQDSFEFSDWHRQRDMQMEAWQDDANSYKRAIKSIKSRLPKYEEKLEEARELLKKIEDELNRPGGRFLYEITIPENDGTNYLPYNGQLSEETTDKLINAIKENLDKTKRDKATYEAEISALRDPAQQKFGDDWLKSLSNEDHARFNDLIEKQYVAIQREAHLKSALIKADMGDEFRYIQDQLEMAFGAKETSEFLSDLGFVGIEYPAMFRSGGRQDDAKNYVIFNEDDAQIINKTEFLKTSDGTVYGWHDNDGIHLTAAGLNPNTPMHEYTHGLMAMLKERDPEKYQKIVEALKDSEVWQEVLNDELYSSIRDDVDAVASEVASRLSGRESERRANESMPARIKRAIQELWDAVAEWFGVKSPITADSIARMTLRELERGTNPDAVMTEGQPLFQIKGVNKSEERTLMGMHNITAEKLRSALKLGGLANPSMAVINTEVGGFTNFGEISLIPSADLIASRTGDNAGTWGADAYSPRFPETHRRLGKGGDKKLSKWVKGLKMRQEMEYNTEEQFNDYYNGFNIRDNALVYPFLHEKGLSGEVDYYTHMNVDQRLENDLREVNGDQWALLKRFDEDDAYKQRLTDIVVGDELKKINKKEGETFQEYRDRRREWAKQIRDGLTGEDGFINRNLAEDLLWAQARAYRENGKFSENRTRDNAEQYIRDHGMEEEYQQYFEQKMQELGAETQIYAGSDSQGRSKFKAADLDQVSKQMKKKGRAGGEGGIFEDSPGAIRAKLLTPMKTLDQIRKNKGRIVDHEQFEKAREDYQNELREYADTYARGSMGALADILTSGNMQATAKQYNIDLDADAVADLNGFKDRVRALPTEYFETKFERPVMLDEFKKVVVPDNLPLDLYGALQRSGLEIVQYPAGDTAARERVTLDAVKDDEDIRFRDDDDVADELGDPNNAVLFRELDNDEDAELIDRLENGPHITTYSTKIKVDDGYVPPMSSKDNETGEMRAPEHEQKWNESEERPDLAKQDKKTGKWKFDLKKSNDKDVNGVLYNPYNHSGSGMLNDQFSEAQDRDDLVVVEQVVPQSEETDKYKAEKANDPTGWKAWKAGPITAKMTGKRKVFLSRWHKITRVVPWSEVADAVAKDLGDQFDVLPTNPFPPQLRAELEKKGYKFVKTDNKCVIQEGEYKGATWSERYYDVYPDRAKSKDKREKGARAKAVKDSNARRRVEELGQRLGVKVTIVDDMSEQEREGMSKKKRRAKGWYDIRTGEVFINLGNHKTVSDIEATFLHEVVAHKGLRRLFGDEFDKFLHNVYYNVDASIREEINRLMAKNNWDYLEATEEYLAKLAQQMNFERPEKYVKAWETVARLFRTLLQKMGLGNGMNLKDSDLQGILFESYHNMEKEGVAGLAESVEFRDAMEREANLPRQSRDTENHAATAAESMFRDDEDDVEDFEDSEDFYEEELEEEAANAEDLGEEVDDSEAGPSSFQEMMLGKMLQAANSAGAAQSARVSAMRSLGGALQQIRKAMSTQRNYDRETVNTIVRLAREVMASGYFNDLTRGEVKRLLAAAKNANGSANVTEQANKVVDTLLRHHLRECENLLKKQLKVKGSKTNTSGVEVQAGLDIEGQRMATAMKQGMRLDDQGLSDRVADCLSRMGSSDPVVAAEASQEWTGLLLAQMYHENIKASRQEEEQMRQEMRQAKAEFAARRDSLSPEELKRQRQDLKDYIAATEDAIRQNRMERADAYNQLSEMLGGGIASSMERAKQWRDEQRERVGEIQHNANSDLQDVPADEHMRPTLKHRMANWAVVRFFMKPLATFDYMLRMMGQKSPNGEGYLWNRFMGGWVEANDKEWRNIKAAHQVLDEKVKEVFNADRPGLPKFKVKRWSDLFFIERKMEGMDVDFWDGDQIKRHTLTPGNLLYIYMVNKMSDGKMKLRKMGMSDADVEAIKNHLDPRLIELADWLQDEFLVQKRIEYNAVHERMFGAPMAAIENYFPLKINSRSRSQEEDVNNQDANPDDNRGSTITGAIIKRVRNNKALDVTGADAFDVILEHIQNMEHWAAFAEFNRDLNTLLSYKRFRNRILNMSSARFGSGQKLWTNFKRVCAIASGVYRPKVDYDSVDTNLVNVAKGVTRAKISFRFYTALKQLLSYPAYLSTANPIELIKSSNPVGAFKAWNWAIDNLPGFAERWQSRQAGDTRLKESDADWGLWKSKIIDTASRWGMSPNAFIDGLTVAMGAKAIYETKFKQLKKLGYSDEQAKQRALRDASVAYNETQQSSANAYTSAMQLDRTAASVALTVFRNASMGYQRRLLQSFANLKHMATKGYKEQSLYYLAKQMERDGLDIPTAKAAAEKVYNRALYQNIADVAIFGWVMQTAWNLGAYLPYLFMGDDDDDKKEMLTDAALHAIAGGIEGLTGGSVISDTYNSIRSGEANMYSNELLPLLSDIESLKRTFKKDVIEGANDLVNLIIQAGVGVNPQTITDWVVAGLDVAKGDPRLANEFGLLVMRVMSAPQGQLDKLYIDELGLTAGEAKQLNAEEFAQRYARYKMGRESTFTGWAYSDEGRSDAFDRYVKNFDRKLKERIDAQDIETLADAYDRGDGHMKGLIEKAIKKYVSELDDTALQSMTSNNGNGKITKIVRSEINKRAKAKAAGMTPEEFSEFNKRVKASVANASEEELRDMYNQADTLARKIIRTALDESIDPEVGDPYKSPNKEYGRIYNRIKTADDMEEDILLAKAQKVAKAAGDDDLAKEIASARSELTEYRKELTGGAGDAQVMKELREARKELINEYVKNK